MRKIDLENHFYSRCTIDALKARKTPPNCSEDESTIFWTDDIRMPQEKILPQLLEVAEARLQLMDEKGVSTAVLSSSAGPEQLDAEVSVEVCRETNDVLYEITKRYPGRYLGSAILPVKDPDAACAELERCVRDYGFVAWHTHSNYGETSPDDPVYRPIFRKAVELGVYVYLHPQLPDTKRVSGYGFTVAGPGLGFTIDTVTTITRMIVSGLFDEIPDLKVVLGHLGEAIPFLMDRMENRLKFLPNPQVKSERDLHYYFRKNIMVTTSGNMSKEAFACAKKVLGIENICFGSDYPYEDINGMMEFLDEVPLSQREREMMFYKNAEERLGIPAEK